MEPDQIVNGSGDPYQKFTPYYETAKKISVEKPLKTSSYPLAKSTSTMSNEISLAEAFQKFVKKENPHLLVHGGRSQGLHTLKTALKTQKFYSRTHNHLSQSTSLLSAYIKFGCVSIREVYYTLKGIHDLIRQLYWREFYSQILYHFPRVLGHALR